MMATPANHVSKPSIARTVFLDAFVPVPRGSFAVAPPPLSWAAKDPADVLDYRLDISAALVGNEGDSIATLDVVISPANPGDLVASGMAADGLAAVVWLSAGQPNTVYIVTFKIGTTSGRILQRSVLLPVLPLSTLPEPITAFITDLGTTITDQSGNPVLAS
jgi:hypothetical protein